MNNPIPVLDCLIEYAIAVPAGDSPAQRAALGVLIRHLPEQSLKARPHMRSTTPSRQRCALYRQYDDQGVLLYIGISTALGQRREAHQKHSAWVDFAAVEQTIWHSSVEEAADAERQAIVDESPLFNVTHSDQARDSRLRDYLVAREAWHLLTVKTTIGSVRRAERLVADVLEADLVGVIG